MELESLVDQAKAVGSERDYLDWLRTQPSALDGSYGHWNMDFGRWENEPAHYRTARNSGTGTKPAFQAIPLTTEQHRLQHRIGQFNFMPREWWEEQVERYLRRYVAGRRP